MLNKVVVSLTDDQPCAGWIGPRRADSEPSRGGESAAASDRP